MFAEGLADIKRELEELQRQQGSIEKQNGSLSDEVSETQQKIEENKAHQAQVMSEIEEIDLQLEDTLSKLEAKEEEIIATNNAIEETEAEIEQLKLEIFDLKDRIETREELLKNRLRALQQSGGDVSYLEVIMGAQNFGDLINRATAVNKIMDQDKSIMETHMAEKQELEDKQVSLEDKKADLDEKKADLESQKQELESLKSTLNSQMLQKEKLMEELKHEQHELEEYQVSLEDEQEILRKQEAAIEKAIEQAKQEQQRLEQLAKENGSQPSENGTFVWPSTGTFTSGYGQRWGKLHAGIDIASGVGTAVKASAAGVVISTNTEWDGKMNGYGNVILIAHSIDGTVYTTLYAHLNSMSVSTGESVSQGETIGTMGNTGNSTGPHLHFEIHKGGWNAAKSNSVNPLSLLK